MRRFVPGQLLMFLIVGLLVFATQPERAFGQLGTTVLPVVSAPVVVPYVPPIAGNLNPILFGPIIPSPSIPTPNVPSLNVNPNGPLWPGTLNTQSNVTNVMNPVGGLFPDIDYLRTSSFGQPAIIVPFPPY
jgi:hypothetical protein